MQTEKKLLQQYAPSLYAKSGLDGNTQYGIALAYTFVQALQKAGKNLTRQSLLDAINSHGKSFVTPGFVPLSYSSSVHYGFEGEEVVKLESSAPPAVTPDRQLDRRRPGQPGRGDEPRTGTDPQVHRTDLGPSEEPGGHRLTDWRSGGGGFALRRRRAPDVRSQVEQSARPVIGAQPMKAASDSVTELALAFVVDHRVVGDTVGPVVSVNPAR